MNTDRHITSVFDRDLEGVQALVLRMGGLVESALAEAADALELADASLARKVMMEDAAIDVLEEQVNSECARLIALRAPTASDLRTVLSPGTQAQLREHVLLVEAILRRLLTAGIASGAFPEQPIETTVPLINACLSSRSVPDDGPGRAAAVQATETFMLRAVGAR